VDKECIRFSGDHQTGNRGKADGDDRRTRNGKCDGKARAEGDGQHHDQ